MYWAIYIQTCPSCFEFNYRTPSCRGVLDTPLYDKLCQSLSTGRWFSLGTPVSSDNHDVTELLLKVAFNTINQPQTYNSILD